MTVPTPRNPSCEARFPWKNITGQAAVGRITSEFTVTCEARAYFSGENTRKVNPRNAAGFLRGAFSLENDKKNLGAIGRITYKFIIALNARRVSLENTRNLEGLLRHAFSLKKDTGFGSGRSRVI